MEPIRIFDSLHAAPKRCTEGTHRTRSPAETFRDFSRWMPQMGITRISNITGQDHVGLPVFQAIRPNARLINAAQGKGVDLESARTSALMEAVEFWHAEEIVLPLRVDTYEHLASREPVVDLHRLPLRAKGRGRVQEGLRRLWMPGYDLMSQRPTWLPLDLVGFTQMEGQRLLDFGPATNGLASGNHILEAITHSLCELIERDAYMVWDANSDFRLLDLSTVDDDHCRHILGLLERAGIQTTVLDITSETGVPTYMCTLIEDPQPGAHRHNAETIGHGTHLSPAVALSRALTEAIQTRALYLAGGRDDTTRQDYKNSMAPELQIHRAGVYATLTPEATFKTHRDLATDSFEGDIALLLERIRRLGVEQVVVADLAHAEIGIPVVFVAAPGLEGSLRFHLPGRRAKEAAAR